METKHSRLRRALILLLAVLMAASSALVAAGCGQATGPLSMLPVGWPAALQGEIYEEPPFEDVPGRTNNAFNVADFGEQGSNGWFYRYGKATKPTQSRQIETQISGSYKVSGLDGLEIKSDFVHTANGVAPILEWRAAEDGAVNVAVTYVKDVNGDSNPSYPDGVKVYVYKGEELLDSHQVEVYTDKQTLLETGVKDLEIKKGESLYFAVDPNTNNAYDGGLLYIAVNDVNTPAPTVQMDERVSNDANNVADYGYQGKNGWTYMYGKSVTDCHLVSTETDDGYMNVTSPALVIKGDFIHPAINDKAILCWTPALSGPIEVRGKYTKFEQNDGNPDWPDGVTVEIYLNDEKLYEQEVPAPAEGTETVEFRHTGLNVTPEDRLYFVVSANGNSSYDGGSFDITVLDRIGRFSENSVSIDESEIRQNIADVQFDFGPQGNNGWFFQEGYKDEPFGALNVYNYLPDDKYYDSHYLEIKRDYANVGENGRSAVIKWKVAQDGVIRIDANYTKAPNQDSNPDWPDGTRVTMWHNHTRLTSQYFAPLATEVTKDLSVESLEVKRGDYITMTINGLENNAYDGGNFHFAIMSLSGLVGPTEKNVTIPDNDTRTNNADMSADFGAQGSNGWFFQYGYNTDPFFAINVEKYNEGESYTTQDGIEIKRDYIMPSTKGKCAQVKWQVAQDGLVNVLADYTKLLNEDANPDWPDGVTVTLLYGNTVLKQEYFAPDTAKEVTKDLSVLDLAVKKGEYITLIVDGGKNTAYDGGLYHFVIEDASRTKPAYEPDTDNNTDLAADFTGAQGAGGWYYAEGRTVEQANELSKKTDDGLGFASVSQSDLQIKKDFVQPGKNKAAMYQWVAGEEGKIDVVGSYTKFGHEDKNPDWPDGTHVTVYLNGTELLSEDVAVKQGEGNDNILDFVLNDNGAGLQVKKGDILTFMVSSRNNVAYDGGRMAVQIYPHVGPEDYKPGTADNNTTLVGGVTETWGENGWYCGYSVKGDGTDFAPAQWNVDKYTSGQYGGLQLKKDGGVEPDGGAAAVYRWVAAKGGDIWLDGSYTKGNFSGSDSDGVHVAVYKNGEQVGGLSYDVTGSEQKQSIKYGPLTVKASDKLDFVITAKDRSGYDYGTLAMKISSTEPATGGGSSGDKDYTNNADTNATSLAAGFSETQGQNGWYFGTSDYNGKNFSDADMVYKNDDVAQWLYNGTEKPDLRNKFVEPGNGKAAAYMWVAAKDGKIKITGNYTKNPNIDGSDADGVTFRILKNPDTSSNPEVMYGGDGTKTGSLAGAVVVDIDKTVDVVSGDKILFVVNPEGNDSYDSGTLEVTITPVGESGDSGSGRTNPSSSNNANLETDFRTTQGETGWYYGYCKWNGSDFTIDGMDSTSDGWKLNGGDPELKANWVRSGIGGDHCAAYLWVAATDGQINITRTYTLTEDTKGAVLRTKWAGESDDHLATISSISAPFNDSAPLSVTVHKGDEILFFVGPQGDGAYCTGKLEVTITDATAAKASILSLSKPLPLPLPEAPVVAEYVNNGEDNSANLAENFSELQGANGWYYGSSRADGKDFAPLGYDAAQAAYIGAGGLKLSANGVRPGVSGDASAAYMWVAAQDGQISLTGSYAVSAEEEEEGGASLRVFHGEEELLSQYAPAGAEISLDETLTVAKGDRLLFVISTEGESAVDGVLQAAIAPVDEPEEELENADNAADADKAEDGEEPEEPAGGEPAEVPGLEEPGDGPDGEEKDKAPGGDAQGEEPETDEAGEPKDGELSQDPAKPEDEAGEEPKDEVKDEAEEKAGDETESEAQDAEQKSKAEDSPAETPEPSASPETKPTPEPAAGPKEPEPLPENGEGEPEPQVKE